MPILHNTIKKQYYSECIYRFIKSCAIALHAHSLQYNKWNFPFIICKNIFSVLCAGWIKNNVLCKKKYMSSFSVTHNPVFFLHYLVWFLIKSYGKYFHKYWNGRFFSLYHYNKTPAIKRWMLIESVKNVLLKISIYIYKKILNNLSLLYVYV